MLGKIFSAAVIGIDAFPVEIEANVQVSSSGGQREIMMSIVGLPDAAVRESRDRIHSAFVNSGFIPPRGFTVVNLAPADIRKEGAAFDLGIALGILSATGAVEQAKLDRVAALGELALDGSVRPVRGALPAADTLASSGLVDILLVPAANAQEAALAVNGRITVIQVKDLAAAVEVVNNGGGEECRAALMEYLGHEDPDAPDFADVKGQQLARRALEISAAGGHNLLMIGPPGTGKSMLAMRLPGILPPMTAAETLETSRIHSVLGLLSSGEPVLNRRPFRSPHHTISDAGLIGGGHDPRPGEISLAHNGVLFLDELPEFKRPVLEVLRQPLETGDITISRASGSCRFPTRFILVAAMNPCPCGRGEVELGCTCRPEEKRRYQHKISGPLLDRIDLRVDVRQLSREELMRAPDGESSAVIRQRVIAARERQRRRFGSSALYCNNQLTPRLMREHCAVTAAGESLLRSAIERFKLSPRAYDRILKTARTIADLAGTERISDEHLFEAITYRRSNFISN